MAKELRLSAEQRLKRGELKALVATASLELGIVHRRRQSVCQMGLAALDRNVSGSASAVPVNADRRYAEGTSVFRYSRDDLIECAALLHSVRRDELDSPDDAGPAARRARATGCRGSRGAGLAGKRSSTIGCAAAGRSARWRERISTRSYACWRGVHHPPGPPRFAHSSRRRQWRFARPARRGGPPHSPPRHDPRHCRLPWCCSSPRTRPSAR